MATRRCILLVAALWFGGVVVLYEEFMYARRRAIYKPGRGAGAPPVGVPVRSASGPRPPGTKVTDSITYSSPVTNSTTHSSPCQGIGASPYYDHDFYFDASFESAYPITRDQFNEIPAGGDHGQIKALLRRLAAGINSTVFVLGGSETLGSNCVQRIGDRLVTGFECAWPARLVRWLHKAFPRSTFTRKNLARGGVKSCGHVASLGVVMQVSGPVTGNDLIILDTLVNDMGSSAGDARSGSQAMCYEALLRSLQDLAPGTALFVLLTAAPWYEGEGGKMRLNIRKQARKVTLHYDLPYIDFSELTIRRPELWYKGDTPSWGHGGFEVHPGWRTHQLLADLISNQLGTLWRAACATAGGPGWGAGPGRSLPPHPVFPLDRLEKVSFCVHPLRAYSSYLQSSLQPLVLDGDWQLREDRRGKPGWIAERPGSKIRFPLKFGAQPFLIITYLQSYEGLGDVKLTMEGWRGKYKHLPYFLHGVDDGYRLLRVSQSSSAFLDNKNLDVPPGVSRDLDIELLARPPGKFKIMDVYSC